MKVLLTDEALNSLASIIEFNLDKLSESKLITMKNQLLNRAQSLALNPQIGQQEESLVELKKGHRRLVEGQHKIIDRVDSKLQIVYITDFFDTRQDPFKMKG